MAPTLSDGDVVLALMVRRAFPGAVVLVRWPTRAGQLSVKRAVRGRGGRWHVEGDFADASTDSRVLGPAHVAGIVPLRIWPRPRRLPRVRSRSIG